jgi:hypothetical protein
MKKLFILLALITAFLLTAYDMPPALPSCFYGEVKGGQAGQVVSVQVNGETVRTTKVFDWESTPVYALKVYMDDIVDGTQAVFYVDGVKAGAGTLYRGTNVELVLMVKADLIVPDRRLPIETQPIVIGISIQSLKRPGR